MGSCNFASYVLAKPRSHALAPSNKVPTLEGFSDCRISIRPATVPRWGKKAVVLEGYKAPCEQLAQQATVARRGKKAVVLEGHKAPCEQLAQQATVPRLRKKAVVLEGHKAPRTQPAQQAGVCPTKGKQQMSSALQSSTAALGHRHGAAPLGFLRTTLESLDES